jgi:hypothetical protein
MANKTIPQLPEQTSKTDNDLLAIVDSGETVTSKIKVSTLLSGVGADYWVGVAGTTDQLYTDFTSIDAAFGANTVLTNGTVNDSLVVGWNNTTVDNQGSYIFGTDNNVTGIGIGDNLSNVNAKTTVIGVDNTALKADVTIGANHIGSGNNPNSIMIGNGNTTTSFRNTALGSFNTVSGSLGISVGRLNASTGTNAAQGVSIGYNNDITTTGADCAIYGGQNNSITGSVSGATIIGLSSYTSAATDDTVYMPAVVLTNYSSYNFPNDTAAAAGGVPLGGIYHNAGNMRIRIT